MKHLTMHRTTPTTRDYLVQNAESANVEKPWPRGDHIINSYNSIISTKIELSCIVCSHSSEETAFDLENGGWR